MICLLLFTFPAHAFNGCDKSAVIEKSLKHEFGEVKKSAGFADGSVIEVYAAEDGSFTVVRKHENGVSCIIISGHYWREIKSKGFEL